MDIVANGEYNIPSGCRVLSLNDTKVQVEDDAGHKVWINIQQILRPMHITSIRGVEDMISLGDLQEYAILRNLHMRYNQKLIYVGFSPKPGSQTEITMITFSCDTVYSDGSCTSSFSTNNPS